MFLHSNLHSLHYVHFPQGLNRFRAFHEPHTQCIPAQYMNINRMIRDRFNFCSQNSFSPLDCHQSSRKRCFSSPVRPAVLLRGKGEDIPEKVQWYSDLLKSGIVGVWLHLGACEVNYHLWVLLAPHGAHSDTPVVFYLFQFKIWKPHCVELTGIDPPPRLRL